MAGESLFAGFEDLRRQGPDAPAVLDIDGGGTFSRDDLMALVEKVDPAVYGASSPNGVVAIQAPNGPEFVAAVLASWRRGLIPLPIDRERSEAETEEIGRTLGIEGVLRGRAMEMHRISGVLADLRLPTGLAVLKLTSGSAGRPRAVAVSESAIESGIAQICSTMGIGSGDRNLLTLPLAHSYAFDNVLGTLVTRGTPAVVLSDLVPRRLFKVLHDTHPTVWPAVPLLLDLLARSSVASSASLGALRMVISAGAPLALATREAFARRFQLRPRTFYGATECGGIAFDREGSEDVPEGCVGRPLDGVSLELVDVQDGVGRVRIFSASVAEGTFPESTKDIAPGRLLAADFGRIDQLGRLHLVGRVGDFVKIHGHKVHPMEVERVLRAIPGVRDAIVVPYSRSRASEGLRAVVSTDDGIDRATILSACERALPAHKIPRSIEIRDELPRNERGKIDRQRL